MATALDRRRCLAALGALGTAGLGPLTVWASAGEDAPARCVAAWDGLDGRHWVGLLQSEASGTLTVLASQALPTRAHGLTLDADGSVLVVARRPGEWLLRWHPRQTLAAQWHWLTGSRVLGGHALVPPGNGPIYTLEQDANDGQGWLVARDRRSLASQAAWPTGGLDPHMALQDGPDHALIANGGVPPGGMARPAEGLRSSLVRVTLRDGAPSGHWTLPDRHLSLRHLARHAGGHVGIALQAEHPGAKARLDAPLLAVFDGLRLQAAEAPPGLGGYGADIAADAEGFVVSASRAALTAAPWGALARWDLKGQRRAVTAWPQAGALGPGWAAGQRWQTPNASSANPGPLVKAWDNHLG